ncbi:hypothetical protein L1887_51597 [Cichorium endivia]|nr:hypothetical protein L1887_51597 [Cichorium endivia]
MRRKCALTGKGRELGWLPFVTLCAAAGARNVVFGRCADLVRTALCLSTLNSSHRLARLARLAGRCGMSCDVDWSVKRLNEEIASAVHGGVGDGDAGCGSVPLEQQQKRRHMARSASTLGTLPLQRSRRAAVSDPWHPAQEL